MEWSDYGSAEGMHSRRLVKSRSLGFVWDLYGVWDWDLYRVALKLHRIEVYSARTTQTESKSVVHTEIRCGVLSSTRGCLLSREECAIPREHALHGLRNTASY
ncbi:unnamed protein product [Anisakis simplex]|uniref:Uncharacterized protein n=1 Tax=Anisakis simplex TaxID=6269 RepID=A0A0M3KGA0_ANISI|nr:unnamed protein product [Anisakis simplex]